MGSPQDGRPLRSLAVADVDLDTAEVHVLPERTPAAEPVQGVCALVWSHARPVGEVVVLGPLDTVLPRLVDEAREALLLPRWQHLLHDALSTPGGLRRARAEGLAGVAHPAEASGSEPSVTVAVCTRDRPESLRGCLQALAQLRTPVLEVVVVDNASTDDRTRQVVAQFPGVRYVHEPRRGLDWARNRALLEARGDVVAYTDDDTEPHPDWVIGLLRAFREEPTASCVTGLVAPRELSTRAQVLFEYVGGFGRGYRRTWFSAAVHRGHLAARALSRTGGAGTGANMAFRRVRALELGGFDTALDVGTPTGGGGDLEMFFRVVAAGDLLVYEPSAVVRHVHRPDMPTLLRQMRGNGTGSYAYFLGAGQRYGVREARQFRRLALESAVHHHLRGFAGAVKHPGRMPLSIRTAESRGAWDAVVRSYYGAAQRQAADELRRHGGPVVEPETRLAAPRPGVRGADPVVTVELGSDEPVAAIPPMHGQTGRRLRVRVLRDGELQHVLTTWPYGSEMSPARLRWELIDHLGPALLEPGLSPDGPAGTSVGAAPAERWAEVLTDGQVQLLRSTLTGERPPVRQSAAGRVGSVSVVLCTRDRPEQLRRTLAALAAQHTERSVQVLVVDTSADPEAARRVVAGSSGAVLLPLPGADLTAARDHAAAHADGAALAYLLDDLEPPVDWLDRLLDPFDEPTIAMVTGNVLPSELDGLEAQLWADHGGLLLGPHRTVFEPEWARDPDREPAGIGTSANAALRTAWSRRLGDDGPASPAGPGDDAAFFHRVLRAGGRVQYEPTAWATFCGTPDRGAVARHLRAAAAERVVAAGDSAQGGSTGRALGRAVLGQSLRVLRQARTVRLGDDDVPADLLRAQVLGHLQGTVALLRTQLGRARPPT
jgi:glycosyltransferase involved in cell wall biosynthesis